MPKGGRKRTNSEYEKEIAEAVKRFRKYPERIKSALNSDDWIDFLHSIGVYDTAIAGGSDFWERVRESTIIDTTPKKKYPDQKPQMYSSLTRRSEKANIYIDTYEKGSVYREVYSGMRTAHRDMSTGKFTSLKKLGYI